LKALIIILIFIPAFAVCQTDSIFGNFVKYYYGTGQLSSEGWLKDGKPEGYWKTYNINGTMKSEGNRRNFLLDSIWTFYDETGLITKKISYLYGKKNGYYTNYEWKKNDTDSLICNIVSKELYVNDVKQGQSFYYENNRLQSIIPFKNGMKEGVAKEFSKDSILTALIEYHNDYVIQRQYMNRYDSKGQKTGVWKEFYSNDRIKREENFLNGKLHGYVREYDANGKVIRLQKYSNGIEVQEEFSDLRDSATVKIMYEYYPNGTIKRQGGFKDGKPVGYHSELNDSGKIVVSIEYDDFGNKIGEGIINEKSQKNGRWKEFYITGEIKAEGEYSNNRRTGEWIFYFKRGKTEQKGSYKNGKPIKKWFWYYETGQILREETFVNGVEEGFLTEYDEDGKIITKGEFFDGLEEGPWFYHVGDHTEEGAYKNGLPDGEWKHYYNNGKLRFAGSYILGNAEGKHKTYYDNGKIKEEGAYVVGKKEGAWKKYDAEGNLLMTITYESDVEKKIDGIKIKENKSE
jgi:uncharacterized protein